MLRLIFSRLTPRLMPTPAVGGELPRIRRPGLVVFSLLALSAGQGDGANRSILIQPGNFSQARRAMGLDDPELFEDDAHMISRLLRQTGTGIIFSELSPKGTLPYRPWPLISSADGKYPTRSRKIEILSTSSYPRVFLRVPTLLLIGRKWTVRVLSPASEWLMNSSHGNDKRICQLQGPAAIGAASARSSSRGSRTAILST